MGRSAFELAGIFRQHGESYRRTRKLPLQQLRVMRAVEVCRTSALGGHAEKCSQCDYKRISYNSCRNRHCPKCQNTQRAKWLEDRKAELLPVTYFHLVFTIPEELARIAFHNKEVVYGILFRTASETLLTIARDPKHLGAGIGFFGILHTWGQNLLHHPHVHFVVPGEASPQITSAGFPANPVSFFPYACCQNSSAASFSELCAMPSLSGSFSSSVRSRRLKTAPLSPNIWSL